MTLDVIFNKFKGGQQGHMAFVQRVNNEGDHYGKKNHQLTNVC